MGLLLCDPKKRPGIAVWLPQPTVTLTTKATQLTGVSTSWAGKQCLWRISKSWSLFLGLKPSCGAKYFLSKMLGPGCFWFWIGMRGSCIHIMSYLEIGSKSKHRIYLFLVHLIHIIRKHAILCKKHIVPGRPGTHVDQAGCKLSEICLSLPPGYWD